MKQLLPFLLIAFSGYVINAQVEVDKAIELTGSGSDARLMGIESVSDAKDAVSAEVLQSNGLIYAAATNAGDAYSVTLVPAVSLSPGMAVHFQSSSVNAGAVTLNVNGTGARDIRKNFNQPLVAGDIRSGQLVSVLYDATNNWFQMVSQLGNVATSGFGGAGMQVFSSSTNWTVPDGVNSIVIEVWGGGGGGSGISGENGTRRGGAGGGYGQAAFSVTPGQVLTISIGSGGSGGPIDGSVAGTGGTTSVTGVGVNISATGGTGGRHIPTQSSGIGGTSSATWNWSGKSGNGILGGSAGGLYFETINTASCPTTACAGTTGTFPGGGGGGAISSDNSVSNVGGAGASGGVKIMY